MGNGMAWSGNGTEGNWKCEKQKRGKNTLPFVKTKKIFDGKI